MSDHVPDPGVPQAPPGPQSEPGAAHTEVSVSAEFATGPGYGAVEGEMPGAAGYPGQVPAGYPGQGPGFPGQGPEFPGQSAEAAPRRSRRAGWIVGLGLGYAVLAAGTAFGVIGQKSPAAVDVTAVDASAYAAGPGSASASSGATAKASPSASQTTTAPTTAAPTEATPTSTVTGTVSNGTHHGDLRFFLLPPPQGPSSVQGDPDGTAESLSDVVNEYGGTSDVRTFLNQAGFKSACDRTYQDSNLGANVTVELIQFGSSSGASDWESGFSYSGDGYKSISVPGESGARGWSYSKDGQYDLVAVYREGDTFFQVELFGTQSLPASDLGTVVSAEHSRLAHG